MPISSYVEDTGATEPKASSIQPSWKNAPTREDLFTDFAHAESGMDEYRANLQIYSETLDGGKALKGIKPGKSTARPLLARKQAEWRYPALSEPILGTRDLFKIEPVGGEDTAAAKQNKLIINNQWATKVGRVKLVDDIVRNLVDEGTAIVKTGWTSVEGVKLVEKKVPDYADAEESMAMMQDMVEAGQMSPEQAQAMVEMGEPMQKGTKTVYVEEPTLVQNHPTYEVCINANVTIDPTCNGVMADAKFAVHAYFTSYAELKENEFVKNEDGTTSGFYHNIDNLWDGEEELYDPFKSNAANNFRFSDKARKQLRAYEYWGFWDIHGTGDLVAIVATWVGTTLVRLEENPYPHKRIPFSVCTYMPIKRDIHGEPDAALLKENQESIGKMTRAIHDTTAKAAIGQEFIDENFFPSPSQKHSYEKGNTVYFRSGIDPTRAIYKNSVQDIGSAPFNVIEWQQKDAAELTGTRPFGGSQGGGKLSGNTQQRDSMDSTAKRELSILRRIAEMFTDMARMTIAMNQVFLSETEIVRITGDEFVTINRDDLEGNFDLSVEISTPEKDEDMADKIWKLMQTNAANTDPEIVKMHYVKLAELWKMPDLADKMEAYVPQPNPMQQELMQLQLEEQRLKNQIAAKELQDLDSKIYERMSRAEDNSTNDAALKKAKADQALAVAEKLRAETDILDATFLEIQSGDKRRKEIEDQEFKANVGLAINEQKSASQIGLEHIKQALARTPGKVIAEI